MILLLRKSFTSISTERIASSLISIVIGVVVVGAFLEWRVEYNAPGANITTLGTASVVGDRDHHDRRLRRHLPGDDEGRLIGSVIMMVGIGLIGTVSATVAAWFVSHKRTREEAARPRPWPITRNRRRACAGSRTRAGGRACAGRRLSPLDTDVPPLVGTLASLSVQIEMLTRQQRELRATIERLADQRGTP